MRIGIIGGTYNPPHIGHIHAARASKAKLGLDFVLFIPASDPPHKDLPANTPTARARLEMTRLAAKEVGAEVCDTEILRGGLSYTADTLKELKLQYTDAEFWLILGTDMLLTIQEWHNACYILTNANIAAVPRRENEHIAILKHARYIYERYGCKVELVDTRPVSISSTELRKDIHSEKSKLCIPSEVYRYIIENKLYHQKG